MLSSLFSSLPSTARRTSSFLPSLSRCYSSLPSRPILGRFNHVPVELARVQSGQNVRLRDYDYQKARNRFGFDVKLSPEGLVLPTKGETFTDPNGYLLRPPLSPRFQEVAQKFRGGNNIVVVLKEGTALPDSLTILQQHDDSYSLQCTKPMTIEDLSAEMTKFLNEHGRQLDGDQFDKEYPLED